MTLAGASNIYQKHMLRRRRPERFIPNRCRLTGVQNNLRRTDVGWPPGQVRWDDGENSKTSSGTYLLRGSNERAYPSFLGTRVPFVLGVSLPGLPVHARSTFTREGGRTPWPRRYAAVRSLSVHSILSRLLCSSRSTLAACQRLKNTTKHPQRN